MSVYYVDKFLYQVDRDPELLSRYAAEPAAVLSAWETGLGTQLGNGATIERTGCLALTSSSTSRSSSGSMKRHTRLGSVRSPSNARWPRNSPAGSERRTPQSRREPEQHLTGNPPDVLAGHPYTYYAPLTKSVPTGERQCSSS
jgi:hypothetical protein